MKPNLLLLLVMIPQIVYSVPPLDLYGFNDKGEFFMVIGEPDGIPYSEISVNSEKEELIYRDQKCGFSTQNTFSCAKGGKTSMSGVIYEFQSATWDRVYDEFNRGDCGEVLSCVDGCNPDAPSELMQAAYGCYEEAVCPDNRLRDEAVVNTNNVNLRLNAHRNSKIIGMVSKGDRVRKSNSEFKYGGTCTILNSRTGKWVHVVVEGAKPDKQGYIFDSFITYK
jgi:hypothetical protein